MDGRRKLITIVSGGASDTTAPTCVVTSASSGATAAAFTATFTFSEAVVSFDNTKITVTNGTAAAVAGTGPYTSVITPTATGTVTVKVAAAAVTDAAGNSNIESNTFSILYIAAAIWQDFSDTTLLYQANNTTTPVTADGQTIGYATDKSGAGLHMTQATADNRPLYKTNIQNGRGAALFDGTDALEHTQLSLTDLTALIVFKPTPLVNYAQVIGRTGLNHSYIRHNTNGEVRFISSSTTEKTLTGSGVIVQGETHLITVTRATNVLKCYKDGTDVTSGSVTDDGDAWGPSASPGNGGYTGYIMERIILAAAPEAAVLTAITSYLQNKWSF